MHTLVVLDNRTFLVPTRHLPPKPWDADQFLEWEVPPDQAKAWQMAKLDAGLQELDRLGGVLGQLLGGATPNARDLPQQGPDAAAELRRAIAGLKRRGGGDAVRRVWDGPEAEGLAKAVDKALDDVKG